MNYAWIFISVRREYTGSKEFFTPFAKRCDKYLLLSRNRFKVCCGDILKCFEINIVKNSNVFDESFGAFLAIYPIYNFKLFVP